MYYLSVKYQFSISLALDKHYLSTDIYLIKLTNMKIYLYIFLLFVVCPLNGNSQGILFDEVLGLTFSQVQQSFVAFGDVDNDNDQDCVISGVEISGRVTRLYLNDGNGVFTLSPSNPFEDVFLSCVAFADIDNDNDLDIFLSGGSSSTYVSKMYRNDGNGNYSEIIGTPFIGVQTGSAAFSDVDNDNDQDILIAGGTITGQKIANLYTNDGLGNYSLASGTFIPTTNSSVDFADVDNDNDPDVLITGMSASGIRTTLYLNDGLGNYTEDSGTPFIGVQQGSAAFSDVDNDNDQDVLILGYNTNLVNPGIARLYINDGFGSFTELMGTPFEDIQLGEVSPLSIQYSKNSFAFGDVDNDNDVDVLMTGFDGISKVTKLYLNNGFGDFSLASGTPLEGVQLSSVAFADVNNDTRQDILITGESNSGNPVSKLYLNTTAVSVAEYTSVSNVLVYPNPTSGKFILKLDSSSEEIQIKIRDISGKLISSYILSGEQSIDLTLEGNPGIYFMEIISENSFQMLEVIKQ